VLINQSDTVMVEEQLGGRVTIDHQSQSA